MKGKFVASFGFAAVLGLSAGARGANPIVYEVSFTNVTHGVILTPPIYFGPPVRHRGWARALRAQTTFFGLAWHLRRAER